MRIQQITSILKLSFQLVYDKSVALNDIHGFTDCSCANGLMADMAASDPTTK
jgi:hypothetical protein